MKTTRLALLVTMLLAAVAARAAAQHTPLTDAQIKAQVEHKLSEINANMTAVQVTVSGGVVTLKGSVPSLWAMREAIDEAREVDDVQSVVNQLTVAAGESDRDVAERIAREIRQYVFYSIFDDVDIKVDGGVVTLTGRVTAPYKASEIESLAGRVPGVQKIDNKIRTLPVSGFDDQLRAAIASRIYRDPLFWNYAIQVNPPIHVVVENGNVTLTGVVRSEVEKRVAETIARSTFGVLGVENQLRLER